jgi:poly(3-hydroxybutyrate) depolymerase
VIQSVVSVDASKTSRLRFRIGLALLLLGLGCMLVPGRGGPSVAGVSASGCYAVRAAGDAPFIDDFESQAGQSLNFEGRGGWWFDFNDGTRGQFRRERVELSANEGSGHALHVRGSNFKTWGSGFGVSLHPASTQGHACPYDATAYTGIRVRARGHGRLRILLADTQGLPAAMGGSCTRQPQLCHDLPGAWIDLENGWKTYDIPFDAFAPEGWGGSQEGADPSQLVAIQFRIGKLEEVEAWLDDLAFTRSKTAAPAHSQRSMCPLDVMPRTAHIEPSTSYAPLGQELTVHTFEQQTKSCGSLTRRYLSFVPKDLGSRSGAPVLVLFHGMGGNAESSRTILARDRFDTLARQHHFIVVYANAAPGAQTSANPQFTNTGSWRQSHLDDGQVDDVEYITLTLADLQARGVIAGENPVLLVGLSNGGGMVLEAARRAPERWRGIAALMPFDGLEPKPVPDLTRTSLRRVLLAYTIGDPAMTPGYHETMAVQPARWAQALGIPDAILAAPRKRLVPSTIAEGRDYRGSNKVALATRDSHATEIDIGTLKAAAQVRVLVMDHAGHFWPNPKGDTEDWIIEHYGFRNQDFDAADMVWDFLREAVEPR